MNQDVQEYQQKEDVINIVIEKDDDGFLVSRDGSDLATDIIHCVFSNEIEDMTKAELRYMCEKLAEYVELEKSKK